MTTQRNIILIGMKSSGKTTTGKTLARRLGIQFTDMDAEIEKQHSVEKSEQLPFREIFKKYGKEYFRTLETATLKAMSSATSQEPFVLATGGGLPMAEENGTLLKPIGSIVYLNVAPFVLLSRIVAGGIPAFFPYPDDPQKSLAEILSARGPIYADLADITVLIRHEQSEEVAEKIINQLEQNDREH